MNKMMLGLMTLACSFSTMANDAGPFNTTISYLGNFKVKYNLMVERPQGLKCIHLKNLNDHTEESLCNPEENFAFNKVYSYKKSVKKLDRYAVTFDYSNGQTEEMKGWFSLDFTQPWLKQEFGGMSPEGFNYKSNVLSEETIETYNRDLDKNLVGAKRVYEVKFDVQESGLKDVACVYLSSEKSGGQYADLWGQESKLEICNNDPKKLAEKLNNLSYQREVELFPEVLPKCVLKIPMGDRVHCTGRYFKQSDKYRIDAHTGFVNVITLSKEGVRKEFSLPLVNTSNL